MQEMLQGIGRRCKPWHESDALEARNNTSCQLAICSETPTCHAGAANALQHFLVLSRQDIDQAVAHFLQAITARQLWASQPGHDCTVVGIDEHRGKSGSTVAKFGVFCCVLTPFRRLATMRAQIAQEPGELI